MMEGRGGVKAILRSVPKTLLCDGSDKVIAEIRVIRCKNDACQVICI